jgi:hypothetical protein
MANLIIIGNGFDLVHLGEINFNFIHIPFKDKIIQVLNHCKSSYFRKSSGCQS